MWVKILLKILSKLDKFDKCLYFVKNLSFFNISWRAFWRFMIKPNPLFHCKLLNIYFQLLRVSAIFTLRVSPIVWH
jgi:hypothetical protein